jgi:hypothetical protein
MKLIAALCGLLLALVAVPAAAEAVTLNGLTPKLPGTTVKRGSAPLFALRVTPEPTNAKVFVRVCPRSKKTDFRGLICEDAWGAIATKRGSSTYSVRTPDYSFLRWWLLRPGTYYWQAFRIYNVDGAHDSYQEGPIKTLRVVR